MTRDIVQEKGPIDFDKDHESPFICAVNNCYKLSRYMPILYTRLPGKMPVGIGLDMRVCPEHMDMGRKNVWMFINRNGWLFICGYFEQMGLPRPNKNDVYLDFEDKGIDDMKLGRFQTLDDFKVKESG